MASPEEPERQLGQRSAPHLKTGTTFTVLCNIHMLRSSVKHLTCTLRTGYHPGAINALTNRKERPHGSGGDQAHWHRPGRGGAAVRRDPLSLERAGRGEGERLLYGGLRLSGPEHARPRRREGGAAPLLDEAVRPLADDLAAARGVPPGCRR